MGTDVNCLNYFSYTRQEMDLEIQRVARELYKALSGHNQEFNEVTTKSLGSIMLRGISFRKKDLTVLA